MAGYLSLHQSIQSLTIKWTPNQLMNGYNEQSIPSSANSVTSTSDVDKSFYWAYVMNISFIDDIVYVHCHQNRSSEETSGTIILVGHDGIAKNPIIFPEGGHMAQFLSCLETGYDYHLFPKPQYINAKNHGLFLCFKNKKKSMIYCTNY